MSEELAQNPHSAGALAPRGVWAKKARVKFALALAALLLALGTGGYVWRLQRSSPASPAHPPPAGDAAADSGAGEIPRPPSDPFANMVLIPAGPFLYGEEKRRIDLPAFYIDRFEVSQGEYARFLEFIRRTGDHSNCRPDEPKGKDHTPLNWGKPYLSDPRFPVVGVDYWDVNAYARWVGKRLPTEEEWEKAARGTGGQLYPWGEAWDQDRCNWGSPMQDHTLMPVDSLPAGRSPYGCYHMLGNAAEWTASFMDKANGVHCGRGYCWRLGDWTPFVVTFRMRGATDLRDEGSGFRCAREVEKERPNHR